MIYLVRHGRTEFNDEGRFQGHCDSPLTPLGLRQAADIGGLLRTLIDRPADWLFTASPLGRAAHSARVIGEVSGIGPPRLDDRLREVGMGSWDGLTEEDIAMTSPDAARGANRYDIFFRSPDGESLETISARLKSWLDEALADGRPRVAVSHGVAGRVLRGLYAGLDRKTMIRLDAPQDAIFRLDGGRIEKIPVLAFSRPER